MNASDYLLTSLNNIRKNKLRSLLTITGVAVAIGALTSMLSFGIGLQENINASIHKNSLITRIQVSAEKPKTISDSLIHALENMKGVEKAFIENRIPAKLILNGQSSNTTIKTLPFSFANYFSQDNYKTGGFFDSDTSFQIVLTNKFIDELFSKADSNYRPKQSDSLKQNLIGKELTVSALSIDYSIMTNMVSTMTAMMSNKLPLRDTLIKFKIIGIVKVQDRSDWGIGAYITQKTSTIIPKLDFNTIWDLMNDQGSPDLKTVSVYTKGIKETQMIQKAIQDMGLKATSFLDNMKEIKQMFIIMDSILGAIGIMALFISTLGLVNTLVMSIYERTKEIGIFKSLGARDNLIGKLFLTEAGCIGLIGAFLGIPLGWAVTKIADLILFSTLFADIQEEIILFSFPWYLILGSVLFSIFFSILAGMYPAMRASKTDPVQALRHE